MVLQAQSLTDGSAVMLFALKAGLEIVFVGKLVAPRALGTILAVHKERLRKCVDIGAREANAFEEYRVAGQHENFVDIEPAGSFEQIFNNRTTLSLTLNVGGNAERTDFSEPGVIDEKTGTADKTAVTFANGKRVDVADDVCPFARKVFALFGPIFDESLQGINIGKTRMTNVKRAHR